MKKFLFTCMTVFFCLIGNSVVHAEIQLWDWGINIDGTTYCLEGPCDHDFFVTGNLTSLAGLPSSINFSSFNLTDDVNVLDGLGQMTVSITGAGPHTVTVYLNYDLDYSINGVYNETGLMNGTPQVGQSWEIDEIGWGTLKSIGTAGVPYIGNIFDNFMDSGLTSPPASILDNTIFFNEFPLPDGQSLVPPIEDTGMGQGWDFDLQDGQTATITFKASNLIQPTGFYTVQEDPDSGTNIYLASTLAFDSGNCTGTLDCLGVCNGTAVLDNCGTCDSNSANDCTQDCAGTWGGNAVVDACGVCGGDNSTCAGCDGVPNSGLVNDACGVCGGDNSTCAGCDGVPNSGLVNDACGVCGGDNSTCAGCDGVPNSGLVNDACGVCGGDNSTCADCAGVPNGNAVVDHCGVCDADPNNDCTGLDSCSSLSHWRCRLTKNCRWNKNKHQCISRVPTSMDCNGDWGGQAYIDHCNTCVGGRTGLNPCVQDCARTWGGAAVKDACGVCDSNPDNDCVSTPTHPPMIYKLDNDDGKPGDDEKIKGYNFGNNQGSSYVRLGDTTVRILRWKDDKIKYEIPKLHEGHYPVTVWVNGAPSNVKWFKVKD